MSDELAAEQMRTSAHTGPLRLSVRDLRISLANNERVDVVDEVSFDVAAGEVLGLVGESGSGKTTVALALLGYTRRGLEVSSGAILIDGSDLLGLSDQEARALRGYRVAYVPQDPASALNPALRIGTQLEEGMKYHPGAVEDIPRRIDQVLEEVHLPADQDYLRRYPHQLSGGQQQRVVLAMAFSCRPSLIVLDEPTTGLDVTTQRHVLNTVRNLCSAYGVAAVYVSHDLAVVSGLASSVAVMYSGRVAEIGRTEEIFNSPIHPYTRGLIAAIPSPERAETLRGIEGQPPRPGRRPRGCFFAPRCYMSAPACVEPPPPIAVASRRVRCWRAQEAVPRNPVKIVPILPQRSIDENILEVSKLNARYRHTEVLHDVSIMVPRDKCVAVVGESGSGKTTLARVIVGLHANYTGDLVFRGAPLARSLRRRPKDSLRRVQYIFQNPYTSLNPRQTIGQIVSKPLERFSALSSSARDERVSKALADASLSDDFIHRYPDQLSGGERQRVAIARALVVEPDLLVCDEVTSALDVSVQATIVQLLRRLQVERHLAMIFITHNLALMRAIAQSVVVLSDGTIVEVGPVDDVLERPQNPYTKKLLEDVPKLSTAAEFIEGRRQAGSLG